MNDSRPDEEGSGYAGSARLAKALNELQPARQSIPPEVDEAVLRAVQAQLRAAKAKSGNQWGHAVSFQRRWLESIEAWTRCSGARLAYGTALTAILAATSFLALFSYRPVANRNLTDLNRDGRVDVLDAFSLAQQAERGVRLSRDLDLNGDGVIDRQDAGALAMRAVRLEEGKSL